MNHNNITLGTYEEAHLKVRLPSYVHQDLKAHAKQNNTTMNNVVLELLYQWLAEQDRLQAYLDSRVADQPTQNNHNQWGYRPC